MRGPLQLMQSERSSLQQRNFQVCSNSTGVELLATLKSSKLNGNAGIGTAFGGARLFSVLAGETLCHFHECIPT